MFSFHQEAENNNLKKKIEDLSSSLSKKDEEINSIQNSMVLMNTLYIHILFMLYQKEMNTIRLLLSHLKEKKGRTIKARIKREEQTQHMKGT